MVALYAFGVLAAVYLNYKTLFEANEIYYIVANGMLAPELVPVYLTQP
jgi:hypothetical protein